MIGLAAQFGNGIRLSALRAQIASRPADDNCLQLFALPHNDPVASAVLGLVKRLVDSA